MGPALALTIVPWFVGVDLSRELTAESRDVRVVDASRTEIFSLVWRRPLVRTGFDRTVGTSFGAPAVSPSRTLVIAGTGEGDVVARSTRDGALAWRYRHGEPFESAVTIVSLPGGAEAAVIGSKDGTLLALEVSSGRLLWQVDVDGDSRAPVRRVGDRLLVATTANRVYAVAAATGAILWSRGRTPPGRLTVHGHAMPAAGGGRVFACYADGYAEAYALEDGAVLWSRPLSLGGGEFVDADADPILAGDRLFVASYSDGIYALNAADGTTLWQRPAPAVVQLASEGELLLAGSADGYLFGLGLADGALAFRTRWSPAPVSRLVVRDGLAVLTAGENGLVVLDARTGKPLQASAFAEAFASDPSWEGRELAFVGASGFLYTLQQRDDLGTR